MTFQDLDFNTDLIDSTVWSDKLFEEIAEELRNYYYLFYPSFSRINQITNGELYFKGLLSPLERKHMGGIALQFEGPQKVRGLQKFMKDSPWNHELMHMIYLDEVSKGLSNPFAMFTLDSSENPYYISNAPEDTDKNEFYQVLTMRWTIEQCFKDGKKYLGMDHYEHRSWPAWHRHMLFVFLAMYFLHQLRNRYKKNSIEYSSPNEASYPSHINNEKFHERKSNNHG
jgi:SRSO17 transposase